MKMKLVIAFLNVALVAPVFAADAKQCDYDQKPPMQLNGCTINLSELSSPGMLKGASLQLAKLYGDYPNADFSNANLSGATIKHADLAGANFSGANLAGLRAYDVNFKHANFMNAQYSTGGWGTQFHGCNLDYANLTDGLYKAGGVWWGEDSSFKNTTWVNGGTCWSKSGLGNCCKYNTGPNATPPSQCVDPDPVG